MKRQHLIVLGAVALAGAVLAIDYYRAGRAGMMRGSATRHLAAPATRAAPLDASIGMITPEHLCHFIPPICPPGWVPHRVHYPSTPGQEIERITYGAPGACVTPAVPRAQRGWLFAPPAEEDY